MGKAGNLYVIRSGDTGYYKIGITKRDVAARLRELQTGNHNKLEIVRCYQVDDMDAVESAVHRGLAKHQVSGEWYELAELSLVDVLAGDPVAVNTIDGYVLRQTGIEAASDRFNFCMSILSRSDMGSFGKTVMFLWALFVPLLPVIEKVASVEPSSRDIALRWVLSHAGGDDDMEELI